MISGDKLTVTTLMGPGVDPHLYKATQGDMTKLDDAEVIFYNGLHLEGQLQEIFDQMGKEKTVFAAAEVLEEGKLLADAEDNSLNDPHVWFDIMLWKEVVDSIGDTLVEEYPEYQEEFEKMKRLI